MRTDDLIGALSQDAKIRPIRPLWVYVALGALALLGWTLYLQLSSGMGVRVNWLHAVADPIVAAKQVLPVLLAIALFPIIRLLRFPETEGSSYLITPAILFAFAMAVLFFMGWVSTAPSLRQENLMGSSQMKCLITIPIYSWVVTGFMFFALKSSAPVNPARTAFLAALFSSALATVIYAFGCTEDSPLFYALWYSVAMFGASLIAGVVGARYLKW